MWESVSHVWPEPWLALAASAHIHCPDWISGKQISIKIQKLPICVLWWQNLKKARDIAADADGKCQGLIGYNIMVATKDYADYVKTAAHAGADVIISGAGLPVDLPEYVTGTDTKIAPIVSSAKSSTYHPENVGSSI